MRMQYSPHGTPTPKPMPYGEDYERMMEQYERCQSLKKSLALLKQARQLRMEYRHEN